MYDRYIIQELEDRYNPENDVIPNAPRVTHTDHQLLVLVEKLLDRVESLEQEVKSLKFVDARMKS